MEMALSHWGFIPERVYEVSSVTMKRTKVYKTEIGTFTYRHTTLPYYSYGIRRAELSAKQAVLIASPEKALIDKIVLTSGIFLRSRQQTLSLLLDDLRLDPSKLQTLNTQQIRIWKEKSQKSTSLNFLIKTLDEL